MTETATLPRRLLLRLGMAGIGVASGVFGGRRSARAADAPSEKVLRIVGAQGGINAIQEVMLQQGNYFSEFGIRPVFQDLSDGSKIIAALISGSADFCGGSGFSSLFPAIEKGADIKILAAATTAPINAIYAKDPKIQTAADLVGRTVGVGAPGTLLHELTVALLEKEGIDYHKVNFVNVGSSEATFKAVVGGTVDAGSGLADYYETAQAKFGVHPLKDGALWDQLPLYTNQALFATSRTIAEKRELLVDALVVYAKLFRFISGPNSRDAMFKARRVVYGDNDDPVQAEAQWRFFQHGRFATGLLLSDDKINYVQQLNVQLGVQKSILPVAQVADFSLAKEALKRLDG